MPSALLDDLTRIVGVAHVLTDPAMISGYVTDWTGRWQAPTAAVVRPGNTEEVAAVVRACADAGVGVVPQGGNTGLVGGSVPSAHGKEVVLSLRRLDTIMEVDPVGFTLSAGAGVTVAAAQQAVAAQGVAFGIDFAARDTATLGGIVATNAGGLRVVRHGSTRAQLLGLEAVLADGRVLRRWTGLAKDNVGYDLPGLLAGSEGTLAVITAVLMRLVPRPLTPTVMVIGVTDVDAARAVLAHVRTRGLVVEAAEFFTAAGLDVVLASSGSRPPLDLPSPVYLTLEVSGVTDDLAASVVAEAPGVNDAVLGSGADGRRLWAYREDHTEAIGATSSTPVVKLDVSVPGQHLASVLTSLDDVVRRVAPAARVIVFGHLAEGNLHVNVLDAPATATEDVADAVLTLVTDHHGSISAEHGVGRAKTRWINRNRSPVDLDTMRAIKSAFDPNGLLNPGVLFASAEPNAPPTAPSLPK